MRRVGVLAKEDVRVDRAARGGGDGDTGVKRGMAGWKRMRGGEACDDEEYVRVEELEEAQ